MEPKTTGQASVKKLDKSRVEITGSIPVEIWEKSRKQAIKHINESITLDGFRKGNIPENILVAKVGNMAILEEMAELALPKAYVDILVEHKIDAVGKPEIHITKLAADNPLEFKAVTAVVPEVTLPDYQKLAAKEVAKQNPEEVKVTDQDIDDAILRIRKSRVSHEDHDHVKMSAEEHEKAIQSSMPELTDDFVKTLGDFKDVPDFKDKLSAMVAEEKKATFREKLRLKIAEAIAGATKAELPDIMVESEVSRAEAQFRADIERMGVKLDDYLKHAKKSIDDIRKEWRPDAEKKAKLQLVLNEIAKKENIKPDAAEIEAEVNHIVAHYKDADRERAAVYAETVLTNDKVFQWLEGQK